MRLDVHPADFDLPRHVAAIERCWSAPRGGGAVTYDELACRRDGRATWCAARSCAAAPSGCCAPTGAQGHRSRRRGALRLHLPGDPALPPPVVLGLLLSRHRLAPLRPGPGARRAAHAGPRRPAGRLHPPYRVLGSPGLLAAGPVLRHPHRVRRVGHGHDPDAVARARLGARRRGVARRPRVRHRGPAPAAPALRLAGPRARCRRRRAAHDHLPRRVRAGRLAQVRRGVRAHAPRQHRLLVAGRALPADGLRRPRRSPSATTSTSRTSSSMSSTPCRCGHWPGWTTSSRRRWTARADQTEAALLERCYDERTGLFFDLAGRGERPVPVSTWSALAPLALPGMPEDVRRRLVEEHLLRPCWLPGRHCGIPSVRARGADVQPALRALALLARARPG